MAGIEYCEGWRDFANMGVACVCTFDVRSKLSRVFFERDLVDLRRYLEGEWTAGFNTKGFDLKLLEANGLMLDHEMHYDILAEVWKALGLDPTRFEARTHGGWSLDNICEATLSAKKSGNGALAPVWWQQGHVSRVADYCLRDVWLEARLLLHILDHRFVVRNDGIRVDLTVPIAVLAAAWPGMGFTA
jgi:hypothetical protein